MVLIRVFFRLIFILVIPLAVAAGTYWYLSTALLGAADPKNKAITIVEIAPGTSFGQIASQLEEKGILKFDWSLTLLARFKKQDTKIKAGEYEFSPSMTPKAILAKLISIGPLRVRNF